MGLLERVFELFLDMLSQLSMVNGHPSKGYKTHFGNMAWDRNRFNFENIGTEIESIIINNYY